MSDPLLHQSNDAVQAFARDFALGKPTIPYREGLAYVRGYSAAVKELLIAAGLNPDELKGER